MTLPDLRERLSPVVYETVEMLLDAGPWVDTDAPHVVDAVLEELDDFDTLVWIAKRLLQYHYPATVFDGSSGDPGPVFVAELREALNSLHRPLDNA